MHRIFVITLIIAAFTAVSCDKSSIDGESQWEGHSYIFFDAEVVEPVESKAEVKVVEGTQLPQDENTAFGVSGVCGTNQLFPQYTAPANIAEVYRKDGIFTYNSLSEWKDAATDHTFYAFYPYSLNTLVNLTPQNSTVPQINYTQPTTVDGMIDILTATKTSKKCNSVDFEFQHRLWRLDVKVKSEIDTVKIKSVMLKLKNYYSSGVLKLDSSTDYGSEVTEGTTFVLHDESSEHMAIPSGDSCVFEPLLFLPVGKGKLQYKLEIVFANGDYVYAYPEQNSSGQEKFASTDIVFEAGKKYTITVDKKYTGLSLNLIKEDWTTHEVNHEFN